MHGDDEMLHGLRERVHDAEAQRSRVAHRTAAVAPDSTGAARAEGVTPEVASRASVLL